MKNCFYVNTDPVRAALEARHWTHRRVAEQLDITASHWSAVLNGRAPLSAEMRRRMLSSKAFDGLPVETLWHRTQSSDGTPI